MKISAIVLAAGESRRMGRTKQLLPLGGKILLQDAMDSLQQSAVDEVILVLGHDAERIRREVNAPGAKIVINPDYAAGMMTSIQHGMAAVDETMEAFFIVLGDLPGISPGVYNELIAEFKRAHPAKSIIVPMYQGRRGHPVLFSMKYREESQRLRGDLGLREILLNHPEDILPIEVKTDAILADIDTPEQYEKYLSQREERTGR
jgi:molybdenum cofactor cytidylyltransferase